MKGKWGKKGTVWIAMSYNDMKREKVKGKWGDNG
jgi:hypothetical protein